MNTIHAVARQTIRYRREHHGIPYTPEVEALALARLTDGPGPDTSLTREGNNSAIEEITSVLGEIEDEYYNSGVL